MPNPDLEVRGGVGHTDPNISGGRFPPPPQKKFFQPFEPQFDLKIRGGGGGGGQAPPLDLPLGIHLSTDGLGANFCSQEYLGS